MTTYPTILAILRDDADRYLWQRDLASIPGTLTAVARAPLTASIREACEAVPHPRFILLSARFYPNEASDVIETIREYHAAVEILLVSPADDPFPAVAPLFRDGIRNLVVAPVPPGEGDGRRESPLRIAVASLGDNAGDRVSTCLMPGTAIHEFALSSSDDKEALIARLERTVNGTTAEAEFLRQRAALVADEMIENSLSGAPRDSGGGRLFHKGESRSMLPGEKIAFRFGFDGETLAMEVADGWGSLRPEEVIEHFSRNRDREGLPPTDGGLGLFLIWRFIDHLHVSITPGQETVVSGHVKLAPPGDLPDAKGFHITAWRDCA
ncbi:ATP-binding protein [Geobacter pickeringii]|uniref:Histidine kinase n=1 Tax=Geobacter pickeringii TaxID=345632 RepID=A0A0B5BDD6_9BACT|nr:ATP-binding protein [Geobacter pickeringii]AJE03134.1 hypothetical protein GPICK_06935 [Geobacter pickeringii]